MYIHFVNLIVTQQIGETPLHHAARSGNTDMVNALLTAGSKVDEKDQVSLLCKYEIELCIHHACINTMTRLQCQCNLREIHTKVVNVGKYWYMYKPDVSILAQGKEGPNNLVVKIEIMLSLH